MCVLFVKRLIIGYLSWRVDDVASSSFFPSRFFFHFNSKVSQIVGILLGKDKKERTENYRGISYVMYESQCQVNEGVIVVLYTYKV